MVVPGSRQVLQKLQKDGSLEILIKAGCRIQEPGCGPCIGMGFVPGDGHLSLRTVNRNWEGRGGNKLGKIALCSTEIAVASALTGVISDPRNLKKIKLKPDTLLIDDSLIIRPKGKKQNIIRGNNIVALKPQTPLPKTIEAKVIIKLDKNISTDYILPAGPLTQHLRSNLPAISKFTFFYKDPEFINRALKSNSNIIVADENYGQGSSREHAALVLKELNIKAVFSKSFARIHRANLINNGIVPLLINDLKQIDLEDNISIEFNDINKISAKNTTKNIKLNITHDLTKREFDIIKNGGILAYTRISDI